MLSKRDLSPDKMETLQRSRTPSVVVTANFEVQTNEEAQVDVHDRDFFVTVQLLEDTSAVYLLESSAKKVDIPTSGPVVTSHTKDGKNFLCKTENFVPLVVLGLSSSSGTSSSST